MRVLILMSTYNGESFLTEQIESLINQKGVDIDILVRDDGSSDCTLQILDSYKDKLVIEKGENVGCAESFRWLLNKSYDYIETYDYFAFCDQDDLWLPEKLTKACGYLKEMNDNAPSMYCSNLRIVDQNLMGGKLKWNSKEEFITKGQSLVCSMATGCTMVFNRKVIEIFHQYPPRLINIHDLWIMHTCIFLGSVYYDKDSFILYRQHGKNVIGAKTSFKSKLISRFRSLKHLFSQHCNENEAKELLQTYGELLCESDKKLISMVANYKSSIYARLKLMTNHDVRRKKDNLFLIARIILGVI